MQICEVDDLTQVHALRLAVFCDEQGVAVEDELDDLDAQAIHLLARDGDQAAATARLFVKGRLGKIGRVCTAQTHRGTGLGLQLMQAAMQSLRDRGCTRAYLSAQVPAIAFYQKLGFVAEGPEYDDAGIAHRDMFAPLSSCS
ncbi:drug:proton antiporter [Thioclava sp. SK-1]|nr:drug:proton antiporter [Thioclava sp. SK-1]